MLMKTTRPKRILLIRLLIRLLGLNSWIKSKSETENVTVCFTAYKRKVERIQFNLLGHILSLTPVIKYVVG